MSESSSILALARPLKRSGGPLYRQLAMHLRDAITQERIVVGEPLPTEARLAEEFGVSLITVRQALRDLEQDGLIRKRAAKSAVVTATAPRPNARATLNSLADIVANTADVGLEITSWKVEHFRPAEALFGLPRGTGCHCLRGRLMARSGPVSIVTIYFPPRIGGQLQRADFDDVVVFRSVQRRLGIKYTGGRVTVRAAPAGPRAAAFLGCSRGAALLINEIIYYDVQHEPIELTIAQHRADRYSVSYDLRLD
jgi:GntR family transcriptional regulator